MQEPERRSGCRSPLRAFSSIDCQKTCSPKACHQGIQLSYHIFRARRVRDRSCRCHGSCRSCWTSCSRWACRPCWACRAGCSSRSCRAYCSGCSGWTSRSCDARDSCDTRRTSWTGRSCSAYISSGNDKVKYMIRASSCIANRSICSRVSSRGISNCNRIGRAGCACGSRCSGRACCARRTGRTHLTIRTGATRGTRCTGWTRWASWASCAKTCGPCRAGCSCSSYTACRARCTGRSRRTRWASYACSAGCSSGTGWTGRSSLRSRTGHKRGKS